VAFAVLKPAGTQSLVSRTAITQQHSSGSPDVSFTLHFILRNLSYADSHRSVVDWCRRFGISWCKRGTASADIPVTLITCTVRLEVNKNPGSWRRNCPEEPGSCFRSESLAGFRSPILPSQHNFREILHVIRRALLLLRSWVAFAMTGGSPRYCQL
jgi:hypothetical protein